MLYFGRNKPGLSSQYAFVLPLALTPFWKHCWNCSGLAREGRTLPGVSLSSKLAEDRIWLNIWSLQNPYNVEYMPCTTRGLFQVLGNLGDQFSFFILYYILFPLARQPLKTIPVMNNEISWFCSRRKFIPQRIFQAVTEPFISSSLQTPTFWAANTTPREKYLTGLCP